jgi:hypothetical protein
MGQCGSPTKQAAVLRKATTYLISDKSEGCPHMTMFGHWGASRSAFLCSLASMSKASTSRST